LHEGNGFREILNSKCNDHTYYMCSIKGIVQAPAIPYHTDARYLQRVAGTKIPGRRHG